MRKFLVYFVIGFLWSSLLFAKEDHDSLADKNAGDSTLWEHRTALVNDFRFIMQSLPDSSKKTLRMLIQKMDTFLLKEDSLMSNIRVYYKAQQDSLLAQMTSMKKDTEKPLQVYNYYEKYKWYAMGVVAALVFLWLFFMIAFFVKMTSSKKKIKHLLPLAERAEKAEEEINSLNEQLNNLKKDLETNDRELSLTKTRYENQLQTLSKEKEELEAKAARLSSLEAELQQLKMEQLQQASKSLELEQLKSEVGKLKEERQQLTNEFTKMLGEKEQIIISLQAEIAQLKRAKEQLSQQFSSIDPEKIKTLQDENERLREKVYELEKEIRESSDWQRKYEDLAHEMERLREELKNYSTKTSADVVDRKEYERVLKQLEEEIKFRKEAEEILQKLIKK